MFAPYSYEVIKPKQNNDSNVNVEEIFKNPSKTEGNKLQELVDALNDIYKNESNDLKDFFMNAYEAEKEKTENQDNTTSNTVSASSISSSTASDFDYKIHPSPNESDPKLKPLFPVGFQTFPLYKEFVVKQLSTDIYQNEARKKIDEFVDFMDNIKRMDVFIDVSQHIMKFHAYAFVIIVDSEGLKTNLTNNDMMAIGKTSHFKNIKSVGQFDNGDNAPHKFVVKNVKNPSDIIIVFDGGRSDIIEYETHDLVRKLLDDSNLKNMIFPRRRKKLFIDSILKLGSDIGGYFPTLPISSVFNTAQALRAVTLSVAEMFKADNFSQAHCSIVNEPSNIKWKVKKGNEEVGGLSADIYYKYDRILIKNGPNLWLAKPIEILFNPNEKSSPVISKYPILKNPEAGLEIAKIDKSKIGRAFLEVELKISKENYEKANISDTNEIEYILDAKDTCQYFYATNYADFGSSSIAEDTYNLILYFEINFENVTKLIERFGKENKFKNKIGLNVELTKHETKNDVECEVETIIFFGTEKEIDGR